ncbi:uncharacterized protein LOC131932257 [Physella acuta]|uniref:uncharacterized protein LOC131932257 n=1 Tax=Physella acuta TaxID=109671 RepID=UPI0027DE20DC|nr:uncharacterized protein LOC131932257 [Physella acuta]
MRVIALAPNKKAASERCLASDSDQGKITVRCCGGHSSHTVSYCCGQSYNMKALHISCFVSFLLTILSMAAHGFNFYGPSDVFKPRMTRYGSNDGGAGFPVSPENDDYIKLITYLNNVGRRRR